MTIARIPSGNVSLAARYPELAPAEAKKKITTQIVCQTTVSVSVVNS